jgi:FkbM family methyltransferase
MDQHHNPRQESANHYNQSLRPPLELSGLFSASRLSFSRSGPLSLIYQKTLHWTARVLSACGLKSVSRKTRELVRRNKETYREVCTTFFEQALKSQRYDLYLDFGAHTGEQALMAGQHMVVIGFEPDVRAYAQLKSNLQSRNPLPYEVTIHNVAVAETSGWAHLNYSDKDPSSTGGSTLETDKLGHSGRSGSECRTIAVGEILEGLTEPNRTILKIDIEGAEYSVLRQMISHPNFSKLGLIFVEFHERKMARGSRLGIALTLNLWIHGMRRSRLIEWL